MLGLMIPSPRAGPVTTGRDEGWSGPGLSWGTKTRAGVSVNEDVAMTYAAALCATRIIAEGVGGLPLKLYRRIAADQREAVMSDVANLVQVAPNPLMTATPFWESRIAHQVNWEGGGFAEIAFSQRTGKREYLWPIHPSRMVRNPEPGYAYGVRNNNGKVMPLRDDEVLHIPGIFPDDGIWSRGVINYGRETIGGAIGTNRASWANLSSGGQPKGILKASGLQDRDKRDAWRKEWDHVHSNPEMNVPTIAIIGQDMTYTALNNLGAEANQIIQARQADKSDMAVLYNVPAYKLPGAEGKETAGTVEQKAIEFVTCSLMPWARKIEEQCWLKLLTEIERRDHYFEHNFTALLRGDTAARYNAYRIAFSCGFMNTNEIRALENLPSQGEEGDTFFRPANMVPLDYAGVPGLPLGSDQNGTPADNPMDREQSAQDRQHHEWLKSLSTIDRAEADQQLKALEHDLEARPIDYREGARMALMNVLPWILTKESNAAQAALAKKGDFEQWLREFYSKQEPLVADALKSACWNLDVAGIKKWSKPTELAAFVRARNVEALNQTYNSDTPETAARRLRAWPDARAKILVDEILGG